MYGYILRSWFFRKLINCEWNDNFKARDPARAISHEPSISSWRIYELNHWVGWLTKCLVHRFVNEKWNSATSITRNSERETTSWFIKWSEQWSCKLSYMFGKDKNHLSYIVAQVGNVNVVKKVIWRTRK